MLPTPHRLKQGKKKPLHDIDSSIIHLNTMASKLGVRTPVSESPDSSEGSQKIRGITRHPGIYTMYIPLAGNNMN